MTADATLEKRISTLFQSSNTILVVPLDPDSKKDGLVWFNTTDKQLKLYSGGVTWKIGEGSAK